MKDIAFHFKFGTLRNIKTTLKLKLMFLSQPLNIKECMDLTTLGTLNIIKSINKYIYIYNRSRIGQIINF